MDLREQINKAWADGAQGTKEVPLQPGIQYVFNIDRKVKEQAERNVNKNQEGPSK